MLSAAFNQQNFRFRTVNPLTAAANAAFSGSDPALNTNLASFDVSADAVFRIRFEIEETAGGGENVTWHLYCSRNGGAFFRVTNLSTIVRTSDNTTYADDTATTNLIAGSARTFLAGYADDSDAMMPNSGNQSWSGNQHTELDIACTVLAADVANGDTLDFQIRKSDGTTITYTRTPQITVVQSAAFNGTASASLAFTTSGTGNYQPAVFNGTAAASLAVSASATGEFLEYAIFRRTPQTGAVFDPDVDTPIVEVVTSPYVDNDLAAAGYDYQVFRRTTTGWSSGSNVEQVSVSAGTFNGTGSASLVLTASATGNQVPPEFNGTASASLAFTASGTGNHAPPGFNGQASASLSLTASGTGDYEPAVYQATGSASLAVSASATGQFVPAGFNGQGTASLAFSANATGVYEPAVYNTTASASLVFTANGQGDAGVPTWNGQGSANLAFTAAATGDHVPPEFNATGAAGLVLTATGTGQFVPAGFTGQASADLAFTTSATGAFDATWSGTGSAFVELTATGTGDYEAAVYQSVGSADLIFTASAVGTEGALPFVMFREATGRSIPSREGHTMTPKGREASNVPS